LRLIHYSAKPLLKVRSVKHAEDGCGAYKTPGLWVSVEGEDDWLAWCRAEDWGLKSFVHATEVVLADDANVLHLSGEDAIDRFTAEFEPKDRRGEWDRRIDWPVIRAKWCGVIIAPYCWPRRLSPHTSWYYGWDCASGVIWDAKAVKELKELPPPDLSAEAA
jgi:hypothetical protein